MEEIKRWVKQNLKNFVSLALVYFINKICCRRTLFSCVCLFACFGKLIEVVGELNASHRFVMSDLFRFNHCLRCSVGLHHEKQFCSVCRNKIDCATIFGCFIKERKYVAKVVW